MWVFPKDSGVQRLPKEGEKESELSNWRGVRKERHNESMGPKFYKIWFVSLSMLGNFSLVNTFIRSLTALRGAEGFS